MEYLKKYHQTFINSSRIIQMQILSFLMKAESELSIKTD